MSTKFVIKNGNRLAVFRPTDAALALQLAKRAAAEKWDQSKFDAILGEQDYVYQGFLAEDTNGKSFIADPKTGERLGDLVPGDSFVSEDVQITAKDAAT